jgi:hypothetical protein
LPSKTEKEITHQEKTERVQFVKGALAMVDILAADSDAKKHRDLRRTEIERSKANVVKVAESIFGYNPFEMEQKDKLYCISSGASCYFVGDIR